LTLAPIDRAIVFPVRSLAARSARNPRRAGARHRAEPRNDGARVGGLQPSLIAVLSLRTMSSGVPGRAQRFPVNVITS